MAVTQEQVLEKIKEIVPKFGVDPEAVTTEATLEDLDMDSLDVVEIMQAIEDDFGIRVPDEDLEDLATMGDAIDAIVKNG
ncbi:MAG TPA: acyl carrier protein [Solirubrobacterales bacterium]|jgi:acyl carrier protein|nr:acyl carrier protein [Solirubrobacterales bacterium]